MSAAALLSALAALIALAPQDPAPGAAPGFPGLAAGRAPQVEIAWNRLYPYAEILAHMDRLAARWPEYLTYRTIGRSVEGRELRIYTLNDPATGPAGSKPAMWVDGNIHGNEVQASEVVLYLAWYLLENRETSPAVAELLADASFHLLPSFNPDGRDRWFAEGHSASSSRSGTRPVDSDRDGALDEDPANDLDGDGSIVQMRKHVPGRGDYRLDRDDPRVLERVPADARERGDWILLGSEGLDDDGDGRLNEDGVGGYDMNRAWPSLWMPEHVQFGAGPYPLAWPETRAIARFLLDAPHVAGVQSFHNAGGMILRGPGAEVHGEYPAEDLRAYDELGRDGERMLPFYRYMVIWKDLYSVFGGFVTWTYEGLGIVSFTNELWADAREFPDDSSGRADFDGFNERRHWFDDHLLMGAGFVEWHPYEHPLYGAVEIGGFKKDVGRVPPSFLIEEMLHRNALFCVRHAQAMPKVTIEAPEVSDLGGGLFAVDVLVRNERAIPTRTAMAAQHGIGLADRLVLEGAGLTVIAGGLRTDRFRPEAVELAERDPGRLLLERGIGSRGELRARWLVTGAGAAVVRYEGEKVADVERALEVR